MRGERPFIFSNLKAGVGVQDIINFIVKEGMLPERAVQCETELETELETE